MINHEFVPNYFHTFVTNNFLFGIEKGFDFREPVQTLKTYIKMLMEKFGSTEYINVLSLKALKDITFRLTTF